MYVHSRKLLKNVLKLEMQKHTTNSVMFHQTMLEASMVFFSIYLITNILCTLISYFVEEWPRREQVYVYQNIS